jgi:hypothetical protein
VIQLLVVAVLLSFPYTALQFAVPIGSWTIDAPLVDFAALALAVLVAGQWLRGTATTLPGWPAWIVLVAVGTAASSLGEHPPDALHVLARKPIFVVVAYGLSLPWAIARVTQARVLDRALTASAMALAIVSLLASVARIASGNATWYAAVGGLTNNHKTLAVAAAPLLPLLWERRARVAWALLALSVLVSMSRTAWIAAAVGMAFFVPWRGRTLADARGALAAIVAAGVLAAVVVPWLSGSVTQLDALRSRASLDRRAWNLFLEHPLLGSGPGSNLRTEMSTFPDYRVNGVDAHGVFPLLGSEYGVLGLAAFGAFAAATALHLRAHHLPGRGTWPAFLALHANLLFSTETFTATHWAVLGVLLGRSQRR